MIILLETSALAMLIRKPDFHRTIGRERRGRVSQLDSSGEGCFDLRRRVNSAVRCSSSISNMRENMVDKTLRWMTENVRGAYSATHPPGHDHAGKHCTNSGTCILVFCYINALGKVLLKGGPKKGPDRDFSRFREFLCFCMTDFMNESGARTWPLTPKNRTGGDAWLYEVYRCGFVHAFYPGAPVAWGRAHSYKKYWFTKKGRLTLNIDELVRGFDRGLLEFRRHVANDSDLQTNFKTYITAD